MKKLATGTGNEKKDAMIAAANERWSLDLGPKDENRRRRLSDPPRVRLDLAIPS